MTNFQQHPDSARDLALSSEDSLDLIDSAVRRDLDDARRLDRARGAAEAIRTLAAAGAFTPEGLAVARAILDAGAGRGLPPRPKLC